MKGRGRLIESVEPAPQAVVSAEDVLTPEEAERMPDTRPDPIDVGDGRELALVSATPLELDAEGLHIDAGGAKKRMRFDRVEAIAVAAVHGLSDKPIIVVDLVLNWMSLADEPLRVVRLRGDRFDPRRLVPGSPSPLEAMRRFIELLLRATDATPLPDLQSVKGLPFAAYGSPGEYNRTVLLVDCDDADGAKPQA